LPTTNQTYDDKQRHCGICHHMNKSGAQIVIPVNMHIAVRVFMFVVPVIVGMAVMVVMIIAQEKRAEQIDT